MRKEETLQKIKAAEGQVRGTKETVLAERERILRDAKREAFELREELRRQAEARYAEILRGAEAAAARETEQILAAGRRDADALKAEADANLDRAIDRVIGKFKGALNA
jgi:V/A-type H+/Na+-transporting ATPase subunit G/H